MPDCIFCKIIKKEIPSTVELETENLIIIRDIMPAAKVHLLVIPKKHICCFDEISKEDTALMQEMISAIQKITEKLGISGNYRVVNNCGENVGQTVKHLHFHILSNEAEPLPTKMC